MSTIQAPAWRASWFNAWLAALGATVLVDGLRLSWLDAPALCAEFHHHEEDIVTLLTKALPTEKSLHSIAISRDVHGLLELPQKASVDVYQNRARYARHRGDWTLGFALTDLAPRPAEPIQRSPLNTPAPKGITIGERAVSSRLAIADPRTAIELSFRGALRVKANGLGFDFTRLTSPTQPVGDNWIDPVVETFALAGLLLIPTRGDGARQSTRIGDRLGTLRWPIWRAALDCAGIDALLDQPASSMASGLFEAQELRVDNSADPTRGVGGRRVR